MKTILRLFIITFLLTFSFQYSCSAQSIGSNSWSGTLDYKDATINFSVDFEVSHSTIEEQYISYVEIRHVVINSINYKGVDYNQSKNGDSFSFPYKIYEGVSLNTTITESVASQNFESITRDIYCTYKTTFTFTYNNYESIDISVRERNKKLWTNKIKVDRIFVKSIDGQSISRIYDEIKSVVQKKEREKERKKKFATYIKDGKSFEGKMEFNKAISSYTKALDLNVNNEIAQERLEKARVLQKKYENEQKKMAINEDNHSSKTKEEKEGSNSEEEESYYNKQQKIQKEKREKEYEYRQKQIEKEKEFIEKQKEEMARKEEIYEKSIKDNADKLGKSVKNAMDQQHQAKMDKWDAEHRQRQAREKMLAKNKSTADQAYNDLKCYLNHELFEYRKSDNGERCTSRSPQAGKKFSIEQVSSNAIENNKQNIYFTYVHIQSEHDDDLNYKLNLEHTKITKFPVKQVSFLQDQHGGKQYVLAKRARKETVTKIRGGFGVTPLNSDIAVLLFAKTAEELEEVIQKIQQVSKLPLNITKNDLLSHWEHINLERGMDLDQLIRTNSLEKQGMVYKTKDNEWVFLNDGKFIVIKNFEILNKELIRINENNQLEIPFWQKYLLINFARFENMYLTTEERTLYAWLNYGFGRKGYKKVPFAFWDPNKTSNNYLYVYKNKYIKEQFSNYKYLEIDGDSYLRTGTYRPAIGYGTYSLESYEKGSLIKFNYEGGLDWTPAIRINKLEEIETVKAKIKLVKKSLKTYVYGDGAYYEKGWDRSAFSTTSDGDYVYTSKPNKFRKYRITDWEIVYKYSDLYTKTDGKVNANLKVKKSYDIVFDSYFPNRLTSSENYKVYTDKDMWFSSDIVPGDLHITNKDDFNSLYNFVSDIKDFIDNNNGDIAYNEQNILTSPKWKDVEIRESKTDKAELNKTDQLKELETRSSDSKWKSQIGSNFTIKHPTKWQFKGDTEDQAEFYVMPIKDNISIAIRFEKSSGMTNINYSNFLDNTGLIEGLKENLDDFVMKENEIKEVNGQRFIKLYFSGKTMGMGMSSETRIYIKGNVVYSLSFYAYDSSFDNYYEDAQLIMDSFKLNE